MLLHDLEMLLKDLLILLKRKCYPNWFAVTENNEADSILNEGAGISVKPLQQKKNSRQVLEKLLIQCSINLVIFKVTK